MKFNFGDWTGEKVCMHCKTDEEAKEFCKMMHDAGRRWRNGDTYEECTGLAYVSGGQDIVYYFNEGTYGTLHCANIDNVTILEFSEMCKMHDKVTNSFVTRVVLDPGAYMPEYAHSTDAGADLRSPIDITVPARGSCIIDTGVHVEIHAGYTGFLKSKSGLNVKHDITSEGVIDAGYTGSICVKLYNHGDMGYTIQRGDKISQLVVMPVHHAEFEQVDKLDETERGDGGFGSTGR